MSFPEAGIRQQQCDTSQPCAFISKQQMLEERKQQLQALQQSSAAARKHQDQIMKTFNLVRAGVEHLAMKLQHIQLVTRASTIMSVPVTLNISAAVRLIFVPPPERGRG